MLVKDTVVALITFCSLGLLPRNKPRVTKAQGAAEPPSKSKTSELS